MNPHATLSMPELVLRVGIIGQRATTAQSGSRRALEAGSAAAPVPLNEALAEVFDTLAASMASVRETSVFRNDTVPTVRVVSALADGADRLAARAALVANGRNLSTHRAKFELHCIFPFDTDIYRDNTIEDRDEFNRLLGEAKTVLVLDGVYEADKNPSNKPAPENLPPRRRRQKAYRAVAWFTLQQSDLVIAIWDPSHEGRPGGTEETLRKALQSGIPALWINPLEGNAISLLLDEDELDLPQRAPALWGADLGEQLRVLLLPAEPATAGKVEPRDDAYQLLAEFLGNRSIALTWRQRLWNLVTGLATGAAGPGTAATGPAAAPMPYFEHHRKRAAELGRYYAGLYRGAFLLNYILAFVAIFIATLGVGLAVAVRLLPDRPTWQSLVLGVLEGCVIGGILANTQAAQRDAWHEKSIDYRFLAELFRTTKYLAPLGCVAPPSHVWTQYAVHNPRQTWMHWFFRSVVRQAPAVLPGFDQAREIRFDREYVRTCLERVTTDWIPSQRAHHLSNAETMGRIFTFIETGGLRIFFVTMWIVAAHVVLDGLVLILPAVAWLAVIERVEPALAFLATVLPAAVLAANGFRFQAECRRLRERSESMAKQLQKNLAAFQRLATPDWAVEGSNGWDVARHTVALAQELVDEVADWRIVYQVHEVSWA